MKNNVTFVSLGPGDPELMTVKALKRLKEADIIFLPATVSPSGKTTSRAGIMVENDEIKGERRYFPLPMSSDRTAAKAVYDQMHDQALAAWQEGKRVAIGVEGDMAVYASVFYVLERLKKSGVSTEWIPGISSFICAAAEAQLSLASLEERLTIIPGNLQEGQLKSLLDSGNVVVVMKLSRCADVVKNFIAANPSHEYHYLENVGTPSTYHTTDCETIINRKIPYFSLIIIR